MLKLPVVWAAWLGVTLSLQATTLVEDFGADPLTRGWGVIGDTNLFHWNPTNQNVEVTWDSSQTNSYFHHPLGTILSRADDFSLAFDLRLNDVVAGPNPNKSGAFELAVGFLNLANATRTNFYRGTGVNSPNLVEFDYFPDAGFGATVWPTFVSTNSAFNYNGPDDYTLITLTTGDWFHVAMTYTASNHTLVTVMTRNGVPFDPIHNVTLSPSFTDFRVDTVSISSYSDIGDAYDSLLAHGVMDNFVVTTPPPPVTNLSGGFVNAHWQVQFISRSNWVYALERTTNFLSWAVVSPAAGGNAAILSLQDTNSLPPQAFYRVRAQRP